MTPQTKFLILEMLESILAEQIAMRDASLEILSRLSKIELMLARK